MTGNESIQILRGTRNKIKGNTLNLLPGQLLYNNTNNYLTIGKGQEGENNSISESNGLRQVKGSPITVPTLEGTFNNVTGDCTIEIGATDTYTGEYYLKPYKNSLLQLYSQNDLNIKAERSLTIFSNCTGTTTEDRLKLVSNHKILNEAPKLELNGSTYIKLNTPLIDVSNVTSIKSTDKPVDISCTDNIEVSSSKTISLTASSIIDVDSSSNIEFTTGTQSTNKFSITSPTIELIGSTKVNIQAETEITKGLKVTDAPSDETDVIRKKELDEAIAALDSNTTAINDGYFLTSITLTDGKITNQTSNNNISGNAANASKLNCDITFTPAETALTPENVRTLIGEKSQIRRGSWYYDGNGYIEKGTTATSQCPFGAIDLAGTTVLQANNDSQGFTQLYITPPTASTTDAITGEMLYYIDNGTGYHPTWYRVLTNANCNSILDDRYVNVTGDTMTGKLTIDLGDSGLDTKVSEWAIETDGNIKANIYSAASDKRLKKNIIPYENKKSILDLPIYEFDYIKNGNHTIGCLAQDLQEICPQLVDEDENGYLSIQESKLIYLLINEIKELKKQIKEDNK